MSLEQAVVQLEQTNAALQEEVVRFRDAAMGLNAVYSTTTEGRQNTADGKYFSVPGGGAYMRLYRRTGSSASLIAEYPSRESMVAAINEATADAEARANAAADRAEVYADNKEFVTLERFRKQATLDLDFGAGDYSVDDGDKVRSTNATDLLTVERATPKWVEGPTGKLREVPPNTIAREWRNGVPQGALIEVSRTNLLLWSEDFTQGKSLTRAGLDVISTSTPIEGLSEAAYVYGNDDTSYNAVRDTSDINDPESYSHYAFVKAAGAGFAFIQHRISGYAAVFDLSSAEVVFQNGSLSNVYIEPMSGGWFKIGASFLNAPEDTFRHTYIGPSIDGSLDGYDDPERGILVAALQKEKNFTPSSYIPTTDSPATRADDNVSRTLGGEFNPSEGTMYLDRGGVLVGNKFSIAIGSETGAYLALDYNSSVIAYFVPFVGQIPGFNSNPNAPHKYAASWQVLGPDSVRLIVARDGGVVINEVYAGDTSTIAEWNKLSVNDRLGSFRRNGEYRDVALLPRALSEQELIELTS